jgi:non-specific serine/threonine protein kinase/serine/threonine-protein kinase
MTPEEWRKAKKVLQAALDLDPQEHANYLDSEFPNGGSLRGEVESLLRSHDEHPTFLEQPVEIVASDIFTATTPEFCIGKRLGPYQVLEQIGKGGMGEVFLARRADDQYQKQVAIKLLRAGEASAYVVSRFRNERQILASLDHPNIARLIDGGSTEEGIPYLVMELVDGVPIDDYCDARKLPTTQRLKLFLEVCSAVQYAHQRLIVHRDLKPGNILVTGRGVPKLLDFGIAKILDPGPLAESSETTLTLFRILTPGYASPEQVRGEPITTASDVYSLGVILYELLTGRSPYGNRKRTHEEVGRAVCEFDPEKPSDVITHAIAGNAPPNSEKIAELREGSVKKLRTRLRGDLDNIILMALRKEPQRRYLSAEQFAADIQRHLDKLPVLARRDTVSYRASKFIARHRIGLAATTVVILMLLAAFAITLQEARIAQRRFNDVRHLANSMIFDIHDSIKDLPGSTPARKHIVDRAMEYLDNLSKEAPRDTSLQRELATAYERVGLVQGQFLQTSLGDTKGCLASYEKAFALRKRIADKTGDFADRLALAQAYRLVATQQWALGEYPLAIKNATSALAISEELQRIRPNDWGMLNELDRDYDNAGTFQGRGYGGGIGDAQKRNEYYNKAMAVSETMMRLRPDDLETLDAYSSQLYHRGEQIRGHDPRAALELFQKELSVCQKMMQRSPDIRYVRLTARSYTDLSLTFSQMGDYQHALECDLHGLDMYKKILATDPQNSLLKRGTAIAYTNTASDYRLVGRKTESAECSRPALELMRELIGNDPSNRQNQGAMAAIAVAAAYNFMGAGKPDQAMLEFEEGCAIYKSIFNASPSEPGGLAKMAYCDAGMGDAARVSGNQHEAERLYMQAIARGTCLNSNSPDLQFCVAAAHAYEGLGDLNRRAVSGRSAESCGEAREWYEKSLSAWEKAPDPDAVDKYSFEMGSAHDVKKKLQTCPQ